MKRAGKQCQVRGGDFTAWPGERRSCRLATVKSLRLVCHGRANLEVGRILFDRRSCGRRLDRMTCRLKTIALITGYHSAKSGNPRPAWIRLPCSIFVRCWVHPRPQNGITVGAFLFKAPYCGTSIIEKVLGK